MKITVYFALISDCSSEFILEMEIDLVWSQLKALVYAVKALLADVAVAIHINGLSDDLEAVRIVVLHVVVLITLVLCCGYLGAKHLSAPARLSPGQSCHAVSCLALDNLAQDDGIFVNLTSGRW